MPDARPHNSRNAPLWSEQNLDNPHAVQDKASRVRGMFAAIAPSYDLNNRVHSLGRDQAWRRAAVKFALVKPGDVVLDVACGTGDLSLAFSRSPAARVIGLDFTFDMLAIAQDKRTTTNPPAYGAADAMALPLPDACCDVVSIAFGIRNVTDPAKALREFYRVLRPGGRLVILEFSLPRNPLLLAAYQFYFRRIMPWTATLIARDRSGAYRYLPQSVNTFLDRAALVQMMQTAGFGSVNIKPLTLGIAVLYRGIRP